MSGITVRISFLRNNTTVDADISPLLTLEENINNVMKMKFGNVLEYLVVYSKYDEVFLDYKEKVELLNLYNHALIYVY